MACLDNETATAYLRGDLEPPEADRWAAHLAECETCRRLIRQVSELMDSVRQDLMLAYTPPGHTTGIDWRGVETLMRTHTPRRWSRGSLTGLRAGYAGAGLVAATLLIALIIGWRETPISAAEAIERATVSERALAADVTRVVHRTLAVEARAANTTAVSRQRVEIWQNAAQGTKVRRLYNASGRLLAGEWTRRDGSRTLYQPDTAPVIENTLAAVQLDIEHVWRWEPSVQSLMARAHTGRVTLARGERGEYLLALDDPIPAAPSVTSASVTLLDDFHPVSQTFVFDTADGRREVRLIERQLETLPPDRVEPAHFVLEPELLPSTRAEVPVSPAKPTLAVPAAAIAVETDRLNATAMRAWYRLHGLGLALGRDALVTRDAGRLQIAVTVPSELRRMVVAQRLEGVGDGARVDIQVVPDAASTAPISGTNWTTSPSYQRIRGQLASRVTSAESADIVASEMVRWLLTESQRIRARIDALSRFSAEWPPDRLRALNLDALAEWQTIVRDHVASAGETAEAIRQRCEALLNTSTSAARPAAIDPINGPGDVPRAIERLVTLAGRQGDLIGAAFPATAINVNQPSELDLGELQTILLEIEGIAARFAGPWPLGR